MENVVAGLSYHLNKHAPIKAKYWSIWLKIKIKISWKYLSQKVGLI